MAEANLTAARLRECVFYEPSTGAMTWRLDVSKTKAGAAVGTVDGRYLGAQVDGRQYLVHRLAWLYVHGVWPAGVIDHKDGNGFNNALDNLRDVSFSVNSQNRQRPSSNNKSGFLGVRWHARDRTWIAEIRLPGTKRSKHLGCFKTAEAASAAYLAAKRAHHEGCTI